MRVGSEGALSAYGCRGTLLASLEHRALLLIIPCIHSSSCAGDSLESHHTLRILNTRLVTSAFGPLDHALGTAPHHQGKSSLLWVIDDSIRQFDALYNFHRR